MLRGDEYPGVTGKLYPINANTTDIIKGDRIDMKHWVERWSELRMKEMMDYSKNFAIHNDYLNMCTEEEIRNGFSELFDILQQIYKDASLNAEEMLLPVHDMNEFRYLSKEERLSRGASFKYAKFLYALGNAGELSSNSELLINPANLKRLCKELQITGINGCLEILTNYGFVFDGFVNGKIKDGLELVLQYPDNGNVMMVLYIMAVKAGNTNRVKDFCRLNYRLLKDDWNTANFGNGVDFVAELLSEQEREVAYLIHEELMNRNYYFNFQEWNEGPQIRYYAKEADGKRNTNATFWLVSMETSMRFYFRLKQMKEALALIENAPESTIQNFLVSDNGCGNRIAGRCVSGVSYELCGRPIWRCGCCNPNFQVAPHKDDYMFYIDLVDSMGRKK